MKNNYLLCLLLCVGISFGQNCVNSIYATQDVVYYDTSGSLIGGGITYNVLSNDYLYNCANDSQIPLIVNGTGQNAIFSTIVNGSTNNFSWNPTTPGSIDSAIGNIYSDGDTFYLEYTVCDAANPSICMTVGVYIVIWDNSTVTPPLTASTTNNNSINKTTATDCSVHVCFNDANLKAFLTSQTLTGRVKNLTLVDCIGDTNNDGEISYYEASQIGGLNLATSGLTYHITDFTGLQYFYNLKVLNIAINNISTLNYSQFPNSIEQFVIATNPITSFDSSYFPNLKTLATVNTSISSLDLGGNPNFYGLQTRNCPNLSYINIKNGMDQNFTYTGGTPDCWSNCPNLTNVCVDASEMVAVQDYLTNCGGNASIVNSNCALATENVVANSFSIAPNPSSGVFTVTFGAATLPLAVEVYDVMGRKVYNNPLGSSQLADVSLSENENSYQIQLDLTNYPSGVYFVSIKTETGTMKQTIIKK